MPHELTTNQKIISLKCSLLLFYTTTNHLDWIVIYDEMYILYDNWRWPAQWLDREEAPKHFSRPNLHHPRSWSLFGGLLLVWSTTAFWILAKPLHLRSMLSKLMRRTENCSACSQHWSTQRVQFCTTTLDCTSQNHCFKSWMNWIKKFCLTWYIQLTSCCFFKHHDKFLQGKFFHNQFSSVQFSRSVVSNSLRPHELQYARLPVHHQLPELTQTHVLRVGDAILPSHPLLSPSPPAPNPSQHQSLFQWVNSSHEVAKVLEFQL